MRTDIPRTNDGTPRYSIFWHPPLLRGKHGTYGVHDKMEAGALIEEATTMKDAVLICHAYSHPADAPLLPTDTVARQMELLS